MNRDDYIRAEDPSAYRQAGVTQGPAPRAFVDFLGDCLLGALQRERETVAADLARAREEAESYGRLLAAAQERLADLADRCVRLEDAIGDYTRRAGR